MAKRYDLIVLGTGTAGTSVAFKCRAAGMEVAIVDSRPFGGTCALRGCNPKKVLVGLAEIACTSRNLKGKGFLREAEINWSDLIGFKNTFTESFPETMEGYLKEEGIQAYHGRAHFRSGTSVAVNDELLEADRILLANGAKPAKLGIKGEEHLATSDDFLDLKALPPTVTFLGGGYISFEFAYVANAAGARARIIHRGKRLLKNFDPDLVDMLVDGSRKNGIEIVTGVEIGAIEKRGDKFIVLGKEGKSFTADLIVHGAGRVPDIEDLNLETAGVEYDRKGIIVNDYLQSVSNPHVYSAGDAAALGMPLTPVADKQAKIAAENIMEGNKIKYDGTGTPSVIFTMPPLTAVGLSEEEAKAEGLDFEINLGDTSSEYNSRRLGIERSGYKVLVEKKTGKILGANILGINAEEVINIFALAIKLGLTTRDLKKVPWTFPSSTTDIDDMV